MGGPLSSLLHLFHHWRILRAHPSFSFPPKFKIMTTDGCPLLICQSNSSDNPCRKLTCILELNFPHHALPLPSLDGGQVAFIHLRCKCVHSREGDVLHEPCTQPPINVTTNKSYWYFEENNWCGLACQDWQKLSGVFVARGSAVGITQDFHHRRRDIVEGFRCRCLVMGQTCCLFLALRFGTQ